MRILEQTSSRVFTDLLSNSPRHSPQFSPGYEGLENMFYFLIQYYLTNQEAAIQEVVEHWEEQPPAVQQGVGAGEEPQ